ncbi:hypothetical protein FSP39_017707 [Pinctada imbricata]|uniref:Major facilitator superfamily (MFS) profile domain-containing protein n=1 Tax=Pinctada imbricata TaxID=66713 RepID=A0AA89C7P3_PINIB|nr:hypothetical protein FSP39_017707 [Pinctada imbricata]
MAYDDVFTHIGSCGPYQRRVYLLQTLPVVFGAIQSALTVFILFSPQHRCSIPSLVNDTFAVQNAAHESVINQTILMKEDDSNEDESKYSECYMYNHVTTLLQSETNDSGFEISNLEYNALNKSSQIVECSEWVYDSTDFESTFVTQSNLVCSRKLHRTHATMSYFGGFALGSLLLGMISDAFGRKIGLLLSLFIHIASNVPLGFVQDYHVFAILRFFSGFSSAGMVQTSFVMDMELVGPQSRMIAGCSFQTFWGVGTIMLAGLAFLFRDWKHLNLAVSVPTVLFISYIWILPESSRWLFVKQRHSDAFRILRKAAKVNKRILPPKFVMVQNQEASSSLTVIFKSPRLVIRTLILCLNWLIVAMEFSGLSLNAGNLSGDVFLNFLLTSLAEVVGFCLCMALLNKVGRKPVYVGSLLIGGISLILTIFTTLYIPEESQWITIALSLFGKMGAAAAFCTAFLYSSEFFPTVIRNSAVGICSFFARIGGMLSPYVADLGYIVEGQFGKILPMAVLGISSFVVGLLTLYLPETLGKKLPETIEHTINYDR